MGSDLRKIMLVVTSKSTATNFLLGFSTHLADSGYEVTLVASEIERPDNFTSKQRIDFVSIKMSRNPNIFQDMRSLIKLFILISRVKPDVVFYATPKASLLSSISSYLLRIPVRIYGLWGLRFETIKEPNRLIYTLIEKIISRLSTSVLANSQSLKTAAINYGIGSSSKIVVLGNGTSHGIDTNKFSRKSVFPEVDRHTEKFLKTNSGFTIGYVGRLHQDKGVDVVIRASQQLTDWGHEVRLLLVGPDEGAKFLEPKQQTNPFSMHTTGEVSDVRPYLSKFDVLVLMSLREGFPNAVLEAASMEIPSIVSNATGCIDSVANNQTGYIVETGDYLELAKKVEILINNIKIRKKFGKEARKRVLRDFEQKVVWSNTTLFISEQIDLTNR